MAELRVDYDSTFSLSSIWYVSEDDYENMYITSGPTTSSKTITLEYKLPSKAEIASAKIHSSWSSPLGGFAIRTVNGSSLDSNGFAPVDIDPTATSINVEFKFKSNGNKTSTGNHSGSTTVSDIYLLVEYSGGAKVSYFYHVENGELIPYRLYHVENGVLVPYNLFKCEDGKLVQY